MHSHPLINTDLAKRAVVQVFPEFIRVPSPETRICREPRHIGEVIAEILPDLSGTITKPAPNFPKPNDQHQ